MVRLLSQSIFFLFATFLSLCQCLIHVWFNALDAQLCLLAPFLVFLLMNWPRSGVLLLLACVSISVAGTGAQIARQHLPPVPIFFLDSVHFIETLKRYIFDLYFLPMQHVSAFAIGSGTAIFLHKDPKIHMSTWVAVIGWIISFAIKFALLFAVYPWNTGSVIPSTFVSVFYGSLCRTIWSLSHCWDFIAGAAGYGGFLETLFSWAPVIPLARMSFAAHTFGPILMLVTAATTRAPYFFTHFLMVSHFGVFPLHIPLPLTACCSCSSLLLSFLCLQRRQLICCFNTRQY